MTFGFARAEARASISARAVQACVPKRAPHGPVSGAFFREAEKLVRT